MQIQIEMQSSAISAQASMTTCVPRLHTEIVGQCGPCWRAEFFVGVQQPLLLHRDLPLPFNLVLHRLDGRSSCSELQRCRPARHSPNRDVDHGLLFLSSTSTSGPIISDGVHLFPYRIHDMYQRSVYYQRQRGNQ